MKLQFPLKRVKELSERYSYNQSELEKDIIETITNRVKRHHHLNKK